jgi:hypothetical protein
MHEEDSVLAESFTMNELSLERKKEILSETNVSQIFEIPQGLTTTQTEGNTAVFPSGVRSLRVR